MSLSDTLKWSRLYGGAISVILIDGQDMSQPLRMETIGRDAFKGVLPLDRWMLNLTSTEIITDLGPDLGKPRFYEVVGTAQGIPGWKMIGLSRYVKTPITGVYFALDTDRVGFDQGSWKRRFDADSGFTELDDETYRAILRAKIRANHWDGTCER
ncbi:anti-CBASS protein Acb1 family protein [Sodalis glossinidius]|uniref:anti-CBASS protein Acb1 family protein n=1 Tax=Sodalis glossinidius TaxID=63612 RepID=UPI0024373305|nr:DUF2612 domain-containing protein [Sodalis glossinidius]